MRKLITACVAAATLTISPALAGGYFPWADYGWRPSYSYRDYYAGHYAYYYPHAVAPSGHLGRGYWRR